MYEFVHDIVFSTRSARFVIFGLSTPLCSNFQESGLGGRRWWTSLDKSANSARDQPVLSFPHWGNHFLAIFSKVNKFSQDSVLSPDQQVFSF